MVLDGNQVVASEDFEYVLQGDSVTVSSTMKRKARNADGTMVDLTKRMALVVDANDFGLRSYVSNLDFDGHTQVRGIIPGDTAMTIYDETDGGGGADRVIQPPGRLFMMDPGLFALFDVVCKNLKSKPLTTKRPIQLLAMSQTVDAVEATVVAAGVDTVLWGGKRTPLRKLQLSDPSGDFVAWVNASKQMLRLEHPASGLVVMRQEPAVPKKPRAATAKKPAAKKPAGGATR